MSRIIKANKSVIVSLDVDSIEKLKKVVSETCSIDGVGGYKIGCELVIPYGIKNVIKSIREITELPIIYDHQKAGTDIPELGDKFFKACKGVSAVILFPVMGPVTERAWIGAAKNAKMPIIVGGEMTHKGFLAKEDGFIQDDSPEKIYEIAASFGVRDFVVPGNKPEKVKDYRELLERFNPTLYAPGFIEQGGSISQSGKQAGERWHAIVGRAIYDAEDISKATKELVKEIV